MEEQVLIKPDISYAAEIAAYRKEFLESGSSMDGCGDLRITETADEWLSHIELYSNKETLPEGKVQSTQFVYVRKADGKILGMINIRHYFNEFLEKYGGNIGYSVRPSERRKGYAAAMLKDALERCKDLGLEKVLITCIDTNEASRKTILKNGGVYDGTVFCPEKNARLERYWIDIGADKALSE